MFRGKIAHALIFYWMPLICYSTAILYLSHQSDPTPGISLPINDKVIHFFEFLILQFLAARAFWYKVINQKKRNLFFLSIVFCFLFAFFDEIHQLFIPGRSTSVYDYIADICGILFCVYIFARINNLFRRGERVKQ